jgi:hypothetical protein
MRAWVCLLVALSACKTVSGSAIATSSAGAPLAESIPVRLSGLAVPEGATEVGIVQAKGTGKLQDLVDEFSAQVRKVGGNYGKIDSMPTKFEMVTSVQSYTYSCGTAKAPATCSGTRTVTTEVATTQLLGRAFLVGQR